MTSQDGTGNAPSPRQMAEAILDSAARDFAPRRMTAYAHWFTDAHDSALVAVIPSTGEAEACDEVLAYALAWQHDRDLLLVVPKTMQVQLATRLPWLGTTVRLYTYDGQSGPTPVSALSRAEVLDRLRDLTIRKSRIPNLTDEQREWLATIDTTGLVAHERSYLSWHHEGLQVLKVSTVRGGLRVQAGVQYTNPPQGREPFDKVFKAAPSPAESDVINAKIRLAIEDGGSKTSQMGEHKMQATLASQAADLGLIRLLREFPAWRGPSGSGRGRTGYVDFLGIDADGRLHVVETKIGHDPRVVLQALDYAMWVRANDAEIRQSLRAQGHDLPDVDLHSDAAAPIHLVLAAKDRTPAFNAYLAGQIEALAGDTRIQVHLTEDSAATPIELQALSRGAMWVKTALVAEPVTGPRWPGRLTTGLTTNQP